jgi:hypothetical protein
MTTPTPHRQFYQNFFSLIIFLKTLAIQISLSSAHHTVFVTNAKYITGHKKLEYKDTPPYNAIQKITSIETIGASVVFGADSGILQVNNKKFYWYPWHNSQEKKNCESLLPPDQCKNTVKSITKIDESTSYLCGSYYLKSKALKLTELRGALYQTEIKDTDRMHGLCKEIQISTVTRKGDFFKVDQDEFDVQNYKVQLFNRKNDTIIGGEPGNPYFTHTLWNKIYATPKILF